jgi:hypothetical protein
VAKPRTVGGHARTAGPFGVWIPKSACGFVRRPIADACDDPNNTASRPSVPFGIPRFPFGTHRNRLERGCQKGRTAGKHPKGAPGGRLTRGGILQQGGASQGDRSRLQSPLSDFWAFEAGTASRQ